MLTIFLDIDGTLHRGYVTTPRQLETPWSGELLTPQEVAQIKHEDEGVTICEFSGLLEEILAPYDDIQIVLSTAWVNSMSVDSVKSFLTPGLAARVVGATHDGPAPIIGWESMERGHTILYYTMRHNIEHWLALDDLPDGFENHPEHLVLTDCDKGIGDPRVMQELRSKLEAHFATA